MGADTELGRAACAVTKVAFCPGQVPTILYIHPDCPRCLQAGLMRGPPCTPLPPSRASPTTTLTAACRLGGRVARPAPLPVRAGLHLRPALQPDAAVTLARLAAGPGVGATRRGERSRQQGGWAERGREQQQQHQWRQRRRV